MNDIEFAEFMRQQVEAFKAKHGDCKDLSLEQISEDSVEFRRRWSQGKKDDTEVDGTH